ncbi:MAG: hypothetical protein C4K58_07215 [Flavobacteriaceae bacterium]|nr:MAG: hypothetical protein C4K58_07215 [Flavobacteriaceae bacterium]
MKFHKHILLALSLVLFSCDNSKDEALPIQEEKKVHNLSELSPAQRQAVAKELAAHVAVQTFGGNNGFFIKNLISTSKQVYNTAMLTQQKQAAARDCGAKIGFNVGDNFPGATKMGYAQFLLNGKLNCVPLLDGTEGEIFSYTGNLNASTDPVFSETAFSGSIQGKIENSLFDPKVVNLTLTGPGRTNSELKDVTFPLALEEGADPLNFVFDGVVIGPWEKDLKIGFNLETNEINVSGKIHYDFITTLLGEQTELSGDIEVSTLNNVITIKTDPEGDALGLFDLVVIIDMNQQ